jgi:peptidoglycan/xylan/chitin deacetylase (PgdA/CDA1 family)
MRTIFRTISKELCARRPLRRIVCWHAPRIARSVALTFDDGPRPETTPKILSLLKQADVRATFFLEGRWAERAPELVRRIQDEGHEIGNHGYEHGGKDLCQQVGRCDQILRNMGVITRLVRPPLGIFHWSELIWLTAHGYRTVLWSFDARDSMRHEGKWAGPPPDYGLVQAGDIILMHDDNPIGIQELPGLIANLRTRNLRPVTLSELV